MKPIPHSHWKDEGTYIKPKSATDYTRVWRLEIDAATTYIDVDGSNNMTLTDAVTGTKTLAQLAAGSGGDVSAAASITDHAIVRGDGGAKGVQGSGITIDDSDGIIIPTATGIDYNPGSDIDADIITMGVTDSPKIYWDESAHQFRTDAGLRVDLTSYFGGTPTFASVMDMSEGGRVYNDKRLSIGSSFDTVLYHRSTSLTANTALANVFVGTPIVPALAANSLIVSNITADGDIVLATQTAGNSQANIFIDASLGSTHILAAGVSQFNVALGRVNIYDDIVLQLGTNGDQAMLNRSTVLNANTALGNVLIGTPVTPAVTANSLILSNITTDGDIMMAGNDGGNSKAFLHFDSSTPDLLLFNVGGTWTAGATTWTIPAVTFGGSVDANTQTISNCGNITMNGAATVDGVDVSAHASRHTDGTDDVADMVGDAGAGGTHGLVVAPGAGDAAAGKFFKADATWAVPAGGGDVTKVGTPADGEVGIWTGDGTIEGSDMAAGSTIKVASNNAMAAEKVGALASNGTVGDGTDDRLDVNTAMTALAGTGGVLELSSEDFQWGSGTVTWSAGVVLRGSGATDDTQTGRGTRLVRTSDNALFLVDANVNGRHYYAENITFMGGGIADGYTTSPLIMYQNQSGNLVFNHCVFRSTDYHAIEVDTSGSYLFMISPHFQHLDGYGVYIPADGTPAQTTLLGAQYHFVDGLINAYACTSLSIIGGGGDLTAATGIVVELCPGLSIQGHNIEGTGTDVSALSISNCRGIVSGVRIWNAGGATTRPIQLYSTGAGLKLTGIETTATQHGTDSVLIDGGASNYTFDKCNFDKVINGTHALTVEGPTASTDNMIARHSGTGGNALQNYTSNPPTISDTGDMNVDGDIDCDNVIMATQAITDNSVVTVDSADAADDEYARFTAAGLEGRTPAELMTDLPAATDAAAGKVELATAAETTTGTDTGRAVTPDGLAGSAYGKRTLSVLVNDSTALTSGDGKAYFPRIPSWMNGWNIIEVAANMVAGTGAVTIMIHNLTQTADILSTALTIDANEKDSKDAATPAVISAAEDDLQTGDRLRIDIDGAGTGTTWLDVQITAQLP